MDELSMIAKGYYQASTDNIQKLALDFFSAMDNDGDGKIDQREFIEFMRGEGYGQMCNPSFFNQLDHDKNGTLDFFEVMTLYYIVRSGRPFCNCCKKFITSTYFTCVGCLEDPIGGSFYLCLNCYVQQRCDHTHNYLSRFIDNYSLLEAMNKSKISEVNSPSTRSRPFEAVPALYKPPSSNNHPWNPSTAMVQVPYQPHAVHNHHQWTQGAPSAPPVNNHTYITNNYSYNYPPSIPVQYPAAPNAIVPHRPHWQTAGTLLGALNAAVHIFSIGGALSTCSIL